MSLKDLIQPCLFVSLALSLGAGSAFAQVRSAEERSSFVDAGFNKLHSSDTAAVGSISGHIFNDAELNNASRTTDPKGFGGIRVVLRSLDTTSQNIVANWISDAAGKYDFQSLKPGRYSVEIDPLSIPVMFRRSDRSASTVTVEPSLRSGIDLAIAADRTISGIVYIDRDNDGVFKAGKDEPVAGAHIMVAGQLAISNASGAYVIHDLPAGRIGMLISWPKRNEYTHVVLDLDTGPETDRVVNVLTHP